MDVIDILTREFALRRPQVQNTVELIDGGNTIPFIARYRKEQTGELDDQVLRELHERLLYLRALEKRKAEVSASIEEQGLLTQEIAAAIQSAKVLAELEDIYRPFKPKRKTRASVAKEKGLQPLADYILAQAPRCAAPIAEAEKFVDVEKGVEDAAEALAGAQDIIAEQISDSTIVRTALKQLYFNNAFVTATPAKGKEVEQSVYAQYKDFKEPVGKIAPHRVLALDRGEREDFLNVKIEIDADMAKAKIAPLFIKSTGPCADSVQAALDDGYSRLVHPAIERELRTTLTESAATGAISVFSQNLKQLLLQPPIKGKVAMGLDPGYRTGCKVAVVDATGKVLDTGIIYAAPPYNKIEEAKKSVSALIKKHGVNVIAIGNGTASKETEIFVADVLKELHKGVQYMMVNEAGASVYSASKLAADEFPEYDVSLRSAVSIARRMQDPLAELVKIDPKAIGVGQYQHDMPKQQLDTALDGVVEYCVNTVGVDLNTASAPLLLHVAGLTQASAKNIVAMREAVGGFKSRSELRKVPKLGPKAFEQCAGFLRIAESADKLDGTAVHPESYKAAEALLKLCGFKKSDIGTPDMQNIKATIDTLGEADIAQKLGIGLPTLHDIVAELLRPARDIRDELPPPMLRSDIMDLGDLKPGMELRGTVRNVIDFGVFVDIGVHQDGLVHISQITNRYIRHPSEVLRVGDIVTVWVLSVDVPKKRISLTMKKPKDAVC